jgi:hypothetical protein
VLKLNINNVEELILKDSSLINKLPHLRDFAYQWKLSQAIFTLKPMGQKAKFDLLNKLTEDDLVVIQEHLGVALLLDKVDYHRVKNYSVKISQTDSLLLFNDFCISRNEDQLYISTWR